MKILHTADWHVGKTVRGRSRAVEHEAVLGEIAAIAEREQVDVVLVVGDLFDTAAPPPDAERIVYRALLDLGADGRPVIVVSGNHDNPRRLAAVAPVFESGGVHVQTVISPVDDGGVVSLDIDGVPLRVALLPFLSQRYVVGADQLMSGEAFEHTQSYAERMKRITAALCAGFDDDAVNIVAAHAMVQGGAVGGGERSAHTIFEYSVPAQAFPVDAHYVALGHLHRTQRIDGPCPIWYPGSPLQMDFGEERDTKQVLVIDAEPGKPVDVTQVPLESGRRFRTVKGTMAQLEAAVGEGNDDFVRVIVQEPARVGLADEIRELFPECVDIRIEAPDLGEDGPGPTDHDADQRSPTELFADYLTAQSIDDDRLTALFAELLEQATGTGATDAA
jgi:exonuclease SbcD